MKKHEIKVLIGKSGGIRIDVQNGEGQTCTDVTKDLELELNQRNKIEEGKKPEYFDPSVSVQNHIQF